MKQTTLLQGAVMAILALVLGFANSSGPAASGNYYTGAPSTGGGTEFTCNVCHNSGVGDYGEPQVNWTIAATAGGANVTTYMPGEIYFITVDVIAPMGSPAGYGFSSTFLQDGTIDNAGTPDNVDANTRITVAGNGRTYVEHNKRTASGSWSFQWMAPDQGTGVVKIYSVGNAVNGMSGTGGDSGSTMPTVITLTEAALPVDLTAFDANVDKATVRLHWQTATEENVSLFEVERSFDGVSFVPIGSVSAGGDSRRGKDYTFTDREAPAGDNYYRLRVLDRDDTFTLSSVVQARVSMRNELTVYPNPTTGRVFVSGQVPATANVRILDGAGRTVLSRTGAGALDLTGFQPGIYLLETEREDTRTLRKVVKY